MVIRLLLVVILLIPGLAFSEPSLECQSALKTLFSEKVSKEQAADFLKLQGDLTLHRLAWAYLKAQKTDQTEKLENVERTILTLLDEKYTNQDPEFIKARNSFESEPLSRTTLADIAPYLKEVLSHEFGEGTSPFVLNASDLKLLHTLAKFEKKNSNTEKYDSRMLARKSPEGMLNFATLVNASYKTSKNGTEEALNIEYQLQGLEKTIRGMQKRISDFVKQLEVPSQCVDETLCTKLDFDEIFNQSEAIQKIFWASLEDKLLSDDIILDKLTYGEIWLKTFQKATPVSEAHKSQSSPSVHEKRVTVIGTKSKVTPVSSVTSYYSSGTGLYVENPVDIIVKDKKGRSAENWKGFGPDFQRAMADAILKDEKVFAVNGKIYDRKTGKVMTSAQVLELLPPGQRVELITHLKSTDPNFSSLQIAARVNGDRSFVFKEKIYNADGNVMSPEWVIAHEMSKKTGTKVDPSRYKGMEHGYLVVRANALMNNEPHFVYKNAVMDTQTGRSLSSPFRSLASTEDVKLTKQKRVEYQNLSDKETIINFNRDNPKKQGCQHYAIVDKKKAEISVYSLAGQLVFQKEILVGVNVSDERTRWSEYGENDRLSSKTTGAGEFTIGAPKTGDYYQKHYSNNILQVEGQNVFAIHQVPNGMSGRYRDFGTGNPVDRRVTGGCVNLKQKDYLALTGWIKPTCHVYVLPEEPGNKFIVKDGKLVFTGSAAVPKNKNYNYTNNKNSYHDIDIHIVNSAGRSDDSVSFVKALESEKKKLMRIFNLSNDDYNDLASVAYGIMGNESDFGRSKKYWIKEHDQGDVILMKAAKRLWNGKNPFDKSVLNTSRGFTQIKDLPEGEWKKEYPGITKETLGDPKNSAVGTIAYLVDAVKVLKNIAAENSGDPRKVKITKENLVDYLGYIYQGRRGALTSSSDPANADFNTYVQKLRKNMSYIEISQKID